ncbi:16S rRNA (cytidine(1402)-2'-O)-methyltransferase [Caldichromatium japonicum]|uniref:Ribosomal RNA small subunit methyltransferase I n=1 Tax=Caldichromatium japonicum TaxID=2699430 RepID=A0A6G7VET9_9GAMM|nr:16S rRNA (cytidine(1402)-2'-O)-methyltransferase [Caldichromatium japonicum]QIK38386.1 16S rRNA (cytidine(1402)-2'-O)-methyltransferase [Caldichromatium japonicum]
MPGHSGILYVVATPIGNLADLSARARRVLGEVSAIAAEDTRTTHQLLNHLGIATELIAYHEHNESAMMPRLLARLAAGEDLALVAEAGTPLISDPGYQLVAAARAQAIRVVPIPGANAAICALSAAGLPSDRFLFLGFPPRTQSRRRTWIEGVANEPGTLILYESPHRILETLADLRMVLGDGRRIVLARELTKRFETFLSGSASELIAQLEVDADQRRGELVILVEGCPSADLQGLSPEVQRTLRILADAFPLSQAAALTARLTGVRKSDLYRFGLELGFGASQAEAP